MSTAEPQTISASSGTWHASDSHSSSQIPPPALASIGRAFQNILERYSGTAMRRVVGVADEYGVDGLYVAFIVMRERTVWPKMRSEDRSALEVAARLMTGFAMMPNATYMQVPPADQNVLVDRVMTSVALWSRQRLIPDLKREYMGLLEEYAERLRPILEAQRGTVIADPLADRPAITIALMEAFETWLATESSLSSRRPMLALLEGLFVG